MLEIVLDDFRLGQRLLAESLAISVPAGEIHALTGPNGCGKTLLFDSISGIGDAEGATCSVAGIKLEKRHPSERWDMGIRRLFQQPALPPSLTVQHILREVGVDRLKRVTSLLENIQIPLSARLAQLSFGQVRIVELCATGAAPRVLLLDEPLAGISPTYQRPLMEFIRQCADSGPAVLCIDHLHASNESFYRKIHKWPSPPDDPDSLPTSAVANGDFPHASLAGLSVSMSPATWVMRRVQVNSTIIATDLRLTVDPGTIALIVGGNGSGKSTLVRALSGIQQPSPSFISSAEIAPPSSDLIFSPQPPKLVPELTIKDNLALMINRRFGLQSEIATKANGLLVWLRGEPLPLNTMAGNLSGGEASLCALVGGILSGRRIVILDEAMEGLSPYARERASALAKQASLKGQSFMLTTHLTTSPSLNGCHIFNLDTDTPFSGSIRLSPT